MWKNLKKTSLINQKAQAILELVTFGSVLLFCLGLLIRFGLQMNYQQNLQMQAFRKAQKMAFYKQGPSSSANLAVIKDKPMVDPADRWGFADRVSMGSGANVTWSNTLEGVYVKDASETPEDRDMPRTYIEINREKEEGIGLADNEINDSIADADIDVTDNKIDPNKVKEKGVFTTAYWKTWGRCPGIFLLGVYLEDSKHEYGPKDYFPLLLDPDEIKVFEDEDEDAQEPREKKAMFLYAGLKRTLSSVVILHYGNTEEIEKFQNGESRQVDIIAVAGTKDCDDDHYCGLLREFLYLDSSAGAIDTSYAEVMPWDTEKALKDKQGLLMDYKKELDYGSGAAITVTQSQTDKKISTTTESSATQTITHKIRLNQSDDSGENVVVEVPVTFSPNQTYNYEVPYENK